MHRYVHIINCTMGGTYFYEGCARVCRTENDHDMALVDFEDGHGRVERFVDPAAQAAAEKGLLGRYVADLNDPKKGYDQ